MATYYFAPPGEGLPGNNGTSAATPWDYPGSMNGKTFAAGDTILFKAGATFYGGQAFGPVLDASNPVRLLGTPASPVRFDIYGGTKRPVISDTDGWEFNDLSGVEVSHFEFHGRWKPGQPLSDWGGWGLSWYATSGTTNASHVYFNDCVAHDFYVGILAESTGFAAARLTDFQVNDCEAYRNATQGITTKGVWDPTWASLQFDNVKVQRCTAHHNFGDARETTTNTGNGIVLGQCKNSLIDQCAAWENGGADAGPSGPVGIWFWNSDASTIQRSVAFNNKRGANCPTDGGGFDIDIDSRSCIMQYNLAWGNDGPGFLVYQGTGSVGTGHVARFNISFGNNSRPVAGNSGEMLVGGNITGFLAYNNTLVSTVNNVNAPALIVTGLGTHASNRYVNNIFYSTYNAAPTVYSPLGTRSASEHLFQGNVYFRPDGSSGVKYNTTTYATLAAWRAVQATQEMNGATPIGFVGDPKLDSMIGQANWQTLATGDPVTLQTGSPAAAIGQSVQTLLGVSPGTRDFSGDTLRASNFSPGASQAPLVSLNTAGIPSLQRVSLVDEKGNAIDVTAAAPIAASARFRDQVAGMKNGSGVAYFVVT